ncbi:hypothetical protein Tco_0869115 [Tanacetum coccineum]
MARYHTTPEELALNRTKTSSDDKHVSDGLDQRNPLVDFAEITSLDNDASKVGSGANMFMKGSLSIGANRFSSISEDSVQRLDVNLDIVLPRKTVNDLEKVHLDQLV